MSSFRLDAKLVDRAVCERRGERVVDEPVLVDEGQPCRSAGSPRSPGSGRRRPCGRATASSVASGNACSRSACSGSVATLRIVALRGASRSRLCLGDPRVRCSRLRSSSGRRPGTPWRDSCTSNALPGGLRGAEASSSCHSRPYVLVLRLRAEARAAARGKAGDEPSSRAQRRSRPLRASACGGCGNPNASSEPVVHQRVDRLRAEPPRQAREPGEEHVPGRAADAL